MDYFGEDNPIAKLNAAAMKARERFAATERFGRIGLREDILRAAAQECVEDMIHIASKDPGLGAEGMKTGEIDRLQQMARVGADPNESIGARDRRLRDARAMVETIMDLEAGRLTPEQYGQRIQEIENPPPPASELEQVQEVGEPIENVPDRDKVIDATAYIEGAKKRQAEYEADQRANLERNAAFRGGEIE